MTTIPRRRGPSRLKPLLGLLVLAGCAQSAGQSPKSQVVLALQDNQRQMQDLNGRVKVYLADMEAWSARATGFHYALSNDQAKLWNQYNEFQNDESASRLAESLSNRQRDEFITLAVQVKALEERRVGLLEELKRLNQRKQALIITGAGMLESATLRDSLLMILQMQKNEEFRGINQQSPVPSRR